jgi:tRNA/tmRNA/rRNA uracil-C5-methylase (TrmA/RlmC/RlmD family)
VKDRRPRPAPRPAESAIPDEIELTIETLTAGGRGLGFYRKTPVFVPFTIPGERARVRVLHRAPNHADAAGIALIEASADRVYPACPHFGPGRCRGCHWQHIDPAVQPLLKTDLVADQLARLGKLSDADIERALRPAIAAPQPWGYNQHLTLTVTEGETGLTLGLPSDDGRVLPIDTCPITHPDVLALRDQLDLDLTGIARLRLEVGSDDAPMLILYVRSEEDAPELEADFPASVNLVLPDNEPLNLIGDSHSRWQIDGRWFRVTAGGAFRPNVGALPGLVGAVMAALDPQPGDAILDLYAGAGVFGAFAAQRAALVTLVESYPPAATDADENTMDMEHVEVIEGAVEAVLPALEDEYAAAIVDPPSSGLSADALEALTDTAPGRIVYVSGDPGTLARDARRLIAAGYALTHVQPIDLAPHTWFIESVARFDRR